MRILREKAYTTKVIAFLFLAFATSSTLTLTSSRPTYAEGPLLGTVRCLLGTVLLQKCPPVAPATTTPTTKPTPPNDSSSSSSSGAKTQEGSQPSGTSTQASSTPNGTAFTAPENAEIALPKDTAAMAPAAQDVATPVSSGPQLSGAEQLAFFNTYSRYAADVQPPQTGASPLERSDEGWRIMGITWYWWMVFVLAGGVVFASVKRNNLRKASALKDV